MQGIRRSKGIALWRVLSAVCSLAFLIWYIFFHANFVLGRSLLLAFPDWEVRYHGAWPLLSGGVVANDVTLIPPEGKEGGKFHFASVRVSVPFVEYYVSGFSRKRGALLNAIQNLRLEFDGGHGDLNSSFSSELAAFGVVSAAPFEAEGCVDDTLWPEDDLLKMGLRSRGTQLTMAYELQPGRLIKQQSIHTPGVGRVDFRRELIKHDNFSLFSLKESGRSELALDEWHVKDEGFVPARNQYCAGKDGIATGQFVQRHIASVRRLIAVVGLAPQPGLEAAYRSYAQSGGNFDVVVRYSPPIGGALYDAEDMTDWLPHMQGTFSIAGNAHPLVFTVVTPRPLPETQESLPTFALIQRETGVAPNAGSEAPVSAQSKPEQRAEVIAAPSRAPVVATNVVLVHPAPALPPPARPPGPGATVGIDSAAVSPADTGAVSSYRDLAGFVGRRMTVYQQGHAPIRVEILRVVEAGDIYVRRHVAGGDIEYVLNRKTFEHAEE